jgi:hypothetical protein
MSQTTTEDDLPTNTSRCTVVFRWPLRQPLSHLAIDVVAGPATSSINTLSFRQIFLRITIQRRFLIEPLQSSRLLSENKYVSIPIGHNINQVFVMSSSNILADRDVNAVVEQQPENSKADIRSMEYHRQVLESKIAEQCVNFPTYLTF